MGYFVQLVKLAALASAVALACTFLFGPVACALVGVATFYVLLVVFT